MSILVQLLALGVRWNTPYRARRRALPYYVLTTFELGLIYENNVTTLTGENLHTNTRTFYQPLNHKYKVDAPYIFVD